MDFLFLNKNIKNKHLVNMIKERTTLKNDNGFEPMYWLIYA